MLQVLILGSGSSGNCALVCTGKTRLLIDAGLSAGQIISRLASVGVGMDTVSGILITHEHGDHCRGLPVLLRKHPLPLLCNALTREVLRDCLPATRHWNIIPNGSSFEYAGLGIDTFSVPHDAADPMGFVLRHGDSALGILTDAGHATPVMRQRLKNLDTLFIEANYDTQLLSNDTKRPWSTKQRISGRHGHLSNEQAAELIVELATARLERVILGHLSRDCNTTDLATGAVRTALHQRFRHDVEIVCAPAAVPTSWHPVRSRPPTATGNTSAPGDDSPRKGLAAADSSASTGSGPVVWRQLELL
ncbi:MAG: phosphoribosyl 1,2-cyclic phosphodiesterase [Verrucomicrobiales bacterium]|nr:phosphoribosyl 1,2-cyclic phosphodiesterase [Verrucomicrobiales bacterium]